MQTLFGIRMFYGERLRSRGDLYRRSAFHLFVIVDNQSGVYRRIAHVLYRNAEVERLVDRNVIVGRFYRHQLQIFDRIERGRRNRVYSDTAGGNCAHDGRGVVVGLETVAYKHYLSRFGLIEQRCRIFERGGDIRRRPVGLFAFEIAFHEIGRIARKRNGVFLICAERNRADFEYSCIRHRNEIAYIVVFCRLFGLGAVRRVYDEQYFVTRVIDLVIERRVDKRGGTERNHGNVQTERNYSVPVSSVFFGNAEVRYERAGDRRQQQKPQPRMSKINMKIKHCKSPRS